MQAVCHGWPFSELPCVPPPVPPFLYPTCSRELERYSFAATEARTYVLPWRGLKSRGMGGKEDSDVHQINTGFGALVARSGWVGGVMVS